MRSIGLAAIGLLALSCVAGQAQPLSEYAGPKASYESMEPETRAGFQVLMSVAGIYNGLPLADYGPVMYRSIREFQASRGELDDGYLTKAQAEAIGQMARPVSQAWRLNTISLRGRDIIVPMGLGLTATKTPNGIAIGATKNRIKISYEWYPSVSPAQSFQAIESEMVRSGDTVSYKVLRDDFLVIHSHQGSSNRYVRLHRDGNGVIGFDLKWYGSDAPVYGDRLAVVMSGSLWASMNGRPFPSYARASLPWEDAPAPRRADPPQVASQIQPPTPPRPAPPPAEKKGVSTGTGFFVSAAGHIATNQHVIDSCAEYSVRRPDGTQTYARLIAQDRQNDLAILKVETQPVPFLQIEHQARLGEQLGVFGYPLRSLLSTSGNFTLGNVTSLQGMNDDTRYLQMSAPIQPGNSGGPAINGKGAIVGVATAKLNALKMIVDSGDLPQNVNFAIRASTLATFLGSHAIPYETSSSEVILTSSDMADKAKSASVFIACR